MLFVDRRTLRRTICRGVFLVVDIRRRVLVFRRPYLSSRLAFLVARHRQTIRRQITIFVVQIRRLVHVLRRARLHGSLDLSGSCELRPASQIT